jgi:small subunit ribosomal protein S1
MKEDLSAPIMQESNPTLESPQEDYIEAAPSDNGASEATEDFSGMIEGGHESEGSQMMEQLLKESKHDFKTLRHGDIIEGTVMCIDREEVLVDIGSKSEGIVPSREMQSLSAEDVSAMKIGDGVLVFVVQPEDQEGHTILSLDRARAEKSWRVLQKQFEAGEVIETEVANYNKGGLLVNLGGVRGFVPASQVVGISTGNEATKQSDMARMVGSNLSLKVIEINRHRNRLILSERQALQEQREAQKEKLIAELQVGQVREGSVTSVCDFGAFVDIGGADGLIHLSELSWRRVNHPSEVLKVGEKVEVFVLDIDNDAKKIALSLKRTKPEPWTTLAERYKVGQEVTGTITQLTSFGAFARIEDGIEGLIHVSELAEGHVAHPRNVVKEGDVLTLQIIRIDSARRRIGLSLRRAQEGQEGMPVQPAEQQAEEPRAEELKAEEPRAGELKAAEPQAEEPQAEAVPEEEKSAGEVQAE